MGKKVTIQDIADALGVSRNTVSKALNNTGILAESTRHRVLEKAAELGYKQFVYYPEAVSVSSAPTRELALFTQSMPRGSHFGSYAINTFQERISANGCRLSIFLIREPEISALQLPIGFDRDRTDGIVCIELFDPEYTKMLGKLGIPILFMDTSANLDFYQVNADLLLMENHDSVYRLTASLIRNGCRRLSFAGDIRHCLSFYERWQGFSDALRDAHLEPFGTRFLGKEVFQNIQDLSAAISQLPGLPEVFICANDFIALDLIRALKKHGIEVPDDVSIAGFDDAPESRVVEPHMTTVHIPSTQMGYIAADMLLSRIENPDMPYRITHVRTDICYRASTRMKEM
ncbi:MAG TPA: LacI family DNA-binding transcriptional regulator [Candidatus Eisenbergiella merdipullorum]|uniref:LacI family DNA-binding transcriptional regulator n=1 Tax=Candidatus Eisenbergiella merdipullorum TaxID=2838553 RepID=A0A9D2I724_9FIRM|nr:LacI family DNA-binding transcriptional regulator [Candidatus Eisenbergiella merdipullorum]